VASRGGIWSSGSRSFSGHCFVLFLSVLIGIRVLRLHCASPSHPAFPEADLSLGEEATSLVWIAVKNSLTTTGLATWWTSGGSMTKKHWQEFAGDLRDCFRFSEVSLEEAGS
jgi:hypothetical protein